MKNVLLIVVAVSFLAIAGETSARAQVTDPIVSDIPFGFTVRDTAFPAGEYTIKRIASVNPGVMQIRSADGTQKMVFLVGSAQANKIPDQTRLIFDRVGDQYFLSEIFEAGNDAGVGLMKSHTERKLEKEGANVEANSVVVTGQTGINARR